MKTKSRLALMVLTIALALVTLAGSETTGWTLVGWNNLGMHCMDSDFSIFSLLPPYNTINAQLIDPSGRLVNGTEGATVTYQGVADPAGSINTTSIGKTNFWDYVAPLYGASPAPDMGLAGKGMPGAANTPQAMTWDASSQWFVAEGIPLIPVDDAGQSNPYPMMHLVARDASGAALAFTDIVLPVSDEMTCITCHQSDGDPMAQPAAGWVYNPVPEKDFRLNVLRLHDDRQSASTLFHSALATAGYDAAGLYATATGGTPILCARCHASNALAGTGIAGVPALTSSIHSWHAHVTDDGTGLPLDSVLNRSACYVCHPGSTTKCLRGVMGSSVASDGTMAMQCQSCHGTMSTVGNSARVGWLEEPACQMCHTGTATSNNGEIRYVSVFDTTGQPRQAVDTTFATNPGVPAAGFSLYRFSAGHGGVKCEGCHGSTHAEWPSSHVSDNIQSMQIQGHAGPLAECSACHGNQPLSVNGGPHGMHSVGQSWAVGHGDSVGENGSGAAPCQACHGTDYRGTVLSYAQADRTISTSFGTKTFWRGYQIGCYTCHDGPNSERANPNQPPVARTSSVASNQGQPTAVTLSATSPQGSSLTYRVVSQPQHGTVGLTGNAATYFPEDGYTGSDSFTWAAWDGQLDSNLATVTLSVNQVTPPAITAVTKPAANTFKLKISGSNFQSGVKVYLADGTTPWSNVVYKSPSLLVIGSGGSLKKLFPKGTAVPITVSNPDGGSAQTSYTR